MKLAIAFSMVLSLVLGQAAYAADSQDIQTAFHAVGDGVHDDTDAFRAAGAAGGTVTISSPRVCYNITGEVDITKPGTWTGTGRTCIKPNLGLGAAKLFCINTSHFHASGLIVNAQDLTFTPATGNHYAFMVGCDGAAYSDIELDHNRVMNFQFSDGTTGFTNLTVSHAFYVQGASNVSIHDNIVNRTSGACVFMAGVSHISILRNSCSSNNWYAINCYYNCSSFEIGWNRITTDRTSSIFWGGGINVMAQPPQPQATGGSIHDNDLSGGYGYGSVIHVTSANHISVVHNRIHDWDIGVVASAREGSTAIVAETRGVFMTKLTAAVSADYVGPITTDDNPVPHAKGSTYPALLDREVVHVVYQDATHMMLKARGLLGTTATAHESGATLANNNGPVANIVIQNNDIDPPLTPHKATTGVQIANAYQGSPATNIVIDGNRFNAVNGNAFSTAILLIGGKGGIQGVRITNNQIQTRTSRDAGVTAAIATGASSPSGAVSNIELDGNALHDLGDGSGSYQVGLAFADTDHVRLGNNTFDGYHVPVFMANSVGRNVEFAQPQTITRLGSGGVATSDNRRGERP